MLKKTLCLGVFLNTALFSSAYVFVDLEGMYVQRGGSTRKVLAAQGLVMPYTSEITSKNLSHNLGYVTAAQLTVGAQNEERGGLLRAFMSSTWKADKSCEFPGLVNFPFVSHVYAPGYYGADQAHAAYRSRLTIFDAYYTKQFTPLWKQYFAFEGMFGAQYFYMPEKVGLDFYSGAFHNTYTGSVHNNLGLLALGLLMQIRPNPVLAFEFRGIGGAGVAVLFAKTDLRILNNTLSLRTSDGREVGACYTFMGTARLTYRPIRFFEISLGYELIYMTGIALPYMQMSYDYFPNSDKKIHHRRDGYVQGAALRLNIKL